MVEYIAELDEKNDTRKKSYDNADNIKLEVAEAFVLYLGLKELSVSLSVVILLMIGCSVRERERERVVSFEADLLLQQYRLLLVQVKCQSQFDCWLRQEPKESRCVCVCVTFCSRTF